MRTKKETGTSNLNCSKKNMKKFFNNEDWNERYNNAPPTMDGIKRELKNMELRELKAFKLKTQTNLAKATLQNRNTALDFGVPVASLVFSILAIILSIRPTEPSTYTISDQKIIQDSIDGISNIYCTIIFLVICTFLILGVLIKCYCDNKKRKYEIFYHQTILNIIESIEKEREYSNHYDVSVHNTETGKTKQYDAYLLPNNK